MKKFICNCDCHYIDIDNRPIYGEDYIGMTIYQYRSEETGKIYKKRKKLGTVVLIGKEATKFKKEIVK
jgi:hypothetical protein